MTPPPDTESLFDDRELYGWIAELAPTLEEPYWRASSGERSTYAEVRCSVAHELVADVDRAHLDAIGRLARAALEARGGDNALARRYAHTAARLCEEIGGLWASSRLLQSD